LCSPPASNLRQAHPGEEVLRGCTDRVGFACPNSHAVGFVPEGTTATPVLSCDGRRELGPALALDAVFHLVPGGGAQHASDHPAAGVR